MLTWIRSIIRYLIQIIYQYTILRRKHVKIFHPAKFNQNTVFAGYNRIHKYSCVSNSNIGRYSYIGNNTILPNCVIGSFCSIGDSVNVVTATHPSHTFVSTSPLFFSTLGQCNDTLVSQAKFDESLQIDGRAAIIGNDVWIGRNVLIKGGIRINDGAIVAMGAVVTKDVPPYAIVGGVPAKIIGYRFSEDEIEFLLKSRWWDKEITWIREHINSFYDINEFKRNTFK